MKAAVTTQGHGESSHGRVPAATVVHLFCGAGRLFKDAQRAPRTRRCVIMMRDWMDAAVLVRQEVNSDFNNWACFKPSSCLLVQDTGHLQSGNHISLCFTVKWVSFNILREHDNGCRRLCWVLNCRTFDQRGHWHWLLSVVLSYSVRLGNIISPQNLLNVIILPY